MLRKISVRVNTGWGITFFFLVATVKLQGFWSSMDKNWKDASQIRSGFSYFIWKAYYQLKQKSRL